MTKFWFDLCGATGGVQECDRQNCLVCTSRTKESKGNSNCQKEGVCYSLKCQACPEGEATYVGQTSSTAFVKGSEHQREYRLHEEGKEGGKKSVMGRDVAKEHQSSVGPELGPTPEPSPPHLAAPLGPGRDLHSQLNVQILIM